MCAAAVGDVRFTPIKSADPACLPWAMYDMVHRQLSFSFWKSSQSFLMILVSCSCVIRRDRDVWKPTYVTAEF